MPKVPATPPVDYADIDLESFVIEDGAPVDGLLTEALMRLLTEPLYSCWKPGRDFMVMADVGMFFDPHEPSLVPDVMLSMDVRKGGDTKKKENLSYFVWRRRKLPEVVIEIVSNREGGEADRKLEAYARIGILYYIIYDPDCLLSRDVLKVYRLAGQSYERLTSFWFAEVGLGLTLWPGTYENWTRPWLRWCDHDGQVIPTGVEQAGKDRQQAKQQRRRAREQSQLAKQETKRAEQERQRAERLAQLLREHGIEPPALDS